MGEWEWECQWVGYCQEVNRSSLDLDLSVDPTPSFKSTTRPSVDREIVKQCKSTPLGLLQEPNQKRCEYFLQVEINNI